MNKLIAPIIVVTSLTASCSVNGIENQPIPNPENWTDEAYSEQFSNLKYDILADIDNGGEFDAYYYPKSCSYFIDTEPDSNGNRDIYIAMGSLLVERELDDKRLLSAEVVMINDKVEVTNPTIIELQSPDNYEYASSRSLENSGRVRSLGIVFREYSVELQTISYTENGLESESGKSVATPDGPFISTTTSGPPSIMIGNETELCFALLDEHQTY